MSGPHKPNTWCGCPWCAASRIREQRVIRYASELSEMSTAKSDPEVKAAFDEAVDQLSNVALTISAARRRA